jgi:single-stranded-DNA-specific exonuclease
LAHDELDDGSGSAAWHPLACKASAGAACLLADAIRDHKALCIVADYDCDGATACAVAMRGLRMLGARHVSYLVPDRVVDGYGLTPPIAQRVRDSGADMLITVDNGIASVEGVAMANSLGLQVLGDRSPPARALNCLTPPSSSTPTSPAAPSRARPWPGSA